MKYYKICRIRCLRCGSLLEHTNRAKTDNFCHTMWCRCGRVGLDPAATGYRILGEPEDYTDLSEEWPKALYIRLEQALRKLQFDVYGIYLPCDGWMFDADVRLAEPDTLFEILFAYEHGQVELIYANTPDPGVYFQRRLATRNTEAMYEQILRQLEDLHIKIWAIYPPEKNSLYPDCKTAGVDMIRPGITFRVWFREERGQIQIKHIERWHMG